MRPAAERIANTLRAFQEQCENLRAAGRDGSVPSRGVTNGLRRLETKYAEAIADVEKLHDDMRVQSNRAQPGNAPAVPAAPAASLEDVGEAVAAARPITEHDR